MQRRSMPESHCLHGDASRAGVDRRPLLGEGGEALHPVARADDLWAKAVLSFCVALRWFVNFIQRMGIRVHAVHCQPQ